MLKNDSEKKSNLFLISSIKQNDNSTFSSNGNYNLRDQGETMYSADVILD